jgi:hypothetical protein
MSWRQPSGLICLIETPASLDEWARPFPTNVDSLAAQNRNARARLGIPESIHLRQLGLGESAG